MLDKTETTDNWVSKNLLIWNFKFSCKTLVEPGGLKNLELIWHIKSIHQSHGRKISDILARSYLWMLHWSPLKVLHWMIGQTVRETSVNIQSTKHLADCPAMSFVFVCWHIQIQIQISWVGRSTTKHQYQYHRCFIFVQRLLHKLNVPFKNCENPFAKQYINLLKSIQDDCLYACPWKSTFKNFCLFLLLSLIG